MLGFGKTKKLEAEIGQLREEMAGIKNEMPDWGGLTGSQWSDMFTLPSSAGVSVTSESAKRSAAVSACVRLIAGFSAYCDWARTC